MGARDRWMVVLAGGQGRRLRPLVEQIYGDDRPKQFTGPIDGRGMLDRTLERMRPLVPAERTIVVTVEAQRRFLPEALANHPGVQVLIQPGDRGTAAAVLWPSLLIAGQDPGAQVLVVPCDHFVGDEDGLRRQLRAAGDRYPGQPVLFGVVPESIESDYGWIELERHGHDPGDPLYGVKGFVEKPDRRLAAECFARGDLWNTLLVLADAMTLVEVIEVAEPDLVAAFAPVYRSPTARAVEEAYAVIRAIDFSSQVLARIPGRLSAWRLPPLRWSDLGTVDRVLDRLRAEGHETQWRTTLTSLAFDPDDGVMRRVRPAVRPGTPRH